MTISRLAPAGCIPRVLAAFSIVVRAHPNPTAPDSASRSNGSNGADTHRGTDLQAQRADNVQIVTVAQLHGADVHAIRTDHVHVITDIELNRTESLGPTD